MLLNQHNLSYQTNSHSTCVRIIISTDFTALVEEGEPDVVSMYLTLIPV